MMALPHQWLTVDVIREDGTTTRQGIEIAMHPINFRAAIDNAVDRRLAGAWRSWTLAPRLNAQKKWRY